MFYISGVSEESVNTHARKGIIYNKVNDYTQIIEFVSSSKAIMEICQEGQYSNTLRIFEVLVYNKKLITDNSNISNYSCCDPRYMKYFSDIDILLRIDLGFFIEDGNLPNYNYSNGFSPISIFKEIGSLNGGDKNA